MGSSDTVTQAEPSGAEKLFRAGGEFGPMLAGRFPRFSRRDFLRLTGFAVTGASVAGCRRTPVRHALPYLVQPEDVVAGRPAYYASACSGCSAGCGLVVKTRDGRPIKLEGNPAHPLSRGGLCADGQASILGLYDSHRLKNPLSGGREAEWGEVDGAIRTRLQDVRKQGKPSFFLSGPVISPTGRALTQKFLDSLPGARRVVLDARFDSSVLAAHARTHGARIQPRFHFDKAKVIVSFDADFLGTWISPVEFTAGYQGGRRPKGDPPEMSYHVQFESRLSLTGSKADRRFAVHPTDIGPILSHLAARLTARAGKRLEGEAPAGLPVDATVLEHLADTLWTNRGRSLVLCGSQDVDVQVLANYLNHILGNYGATVDLERPAYQAQGDDAELADLLRLAAEGKVGALFVYACNPVHDLPDGEGLAEAMGRIPLVVALGERLDETARHAEFVCPVPHSLETWGDAEPVEGLVSVSQPTLLPQGNTRPLLESLVAWTSAPGGGRATSAYDLVRAHWEANIYLRRPGAESFEAFWNQTLHNGFAQIRPQRPQPADFREQAVRLTAGMTSRPADSYTVVLYSKVGVPESAHAYNPWLHELPDPITKVTWDNYACLSPAAAERLGVKDGDVLRLDVPDAGPGTRAVELPALVQPGQHDGVIAVALGYGSVLSERFAGIGPAWLDARPTVGDDGRVGKNAAALLRWLDKTLCRHRDGVRVEKTGGHQALASTRDYQRSEPPDALVPGRSPTQSVVRQASLAGRHAGQARTPLPMAEPERDLWPDDHPGDGPRWGMVIDQNACTGCSACVVACQSENNIPVVGKDEVRRHREMHWLRIDSYYSGGAGGVEVVHQPMLCQHCGNAPCEPVCPVLATVHSEEGLNQQVYNRCVGTRYCANNCPYKVRRFNWFDYARDDVLQNLLLNPDVTVRTRGVMEKCTFCVQRIQDANSQAAGAPVRDGELQTACQQSCPARAITFGNLRDAQSRVAREARDPRGYVVLEELNVRPSVRYLMPVRNRPADAEGSGRG
jgi:molybdopterin-containing oxidoreductase family iron-sulfur binding subunit